MADAAAGTTATTGGIWEAPFGRTTDGQEVTLYTLVNGRGAEARIMTYGGTVVSLKVPDGNGASGDVVLGYDTLAPYLTHSPYFGCLIGRFGNRIAKGEFTLNGKRYTLARNDGPNALHGGPKGFDKVVWKAQPRQSAAGPAVALTHVSHDGEEGYPGALAVTATYTLTVNHELRLDFQARAESDTIVNLTHHSYFNLAGRGDVLDHVVELNADAFTPVDDTLIPTGELRPVAGTPFDFREPRAIGARINEADPQLKRGHGYDHNWVLNKPADALGLAARVSDATSGRVMEVFTTEPGIQFYTGNFLDGSLTGKGGWVYQRRNGLCLEPQHFPDSPNRPEFPSTVLKAGQTRGSAIVYRFSTRKAQAR
jgi:aldose 1-epimerase